MASAPDDSALYVLAGEGVERVSTSDLAAQRTLLQGSPLRGVALSADGSLLYGLGAQLTAVSTADGTKRGSSQAAPGAVAIVHVSAAR